MKTGTIPSQTESNIKRSSKLIKIHIYNHFDKNPGNVSCLQITTFDEFAQDDVSQN